MAVAAFQNRWAVLGLLVFARVGMAMQFQAVAPIAPLLVTDLDLSYAQIGTLIGVSTLAGVFLALPAGLLGRRFGDKAVALVALGLLTGGAVLFAQGTQYAVLLAGRLLSGIGMVLLNVQLTKMVTDRFAGSELATSMAILMTAWPFGIALALVSLGPVAAAYGWPLSTELTALLCAVALIGVAVFYRDAPSDAASGSAADMPKVWAIRTSEIILVLVAGLVWMLPNAGFIVFVSFAPTLLVATGMGMAAAGAMVSLVSWISTGSIPLGGWLTDRSGRHSAFIVIGLCACAALTWAMAAGGPVLLWMALFGIALGGWPGAVMTLPGQALSAPSRSTGFGLFYTVHYLGMTSLVPVAGWLRDRTGSAAAPVVFAGCLMLAGIGALGALRLLQRRWPVADGVQAPVPQGERREPGFDALE